MSTRRIEAGAVRAALASFRRWRRTRPFWAGVFTLLAGLIVLFPPFASLKFGDVVVSLNTLGGVSALLIGAVQLLCALSFCASPQYRVPAGVVTFLLSLVAIVTANLGSLLMGTTLGLIGASLGLAWSPKPRQSRRRSAQGAPDAAAGGEATAGDEADSAPRPTSQRRSEPAVPGSSA